MYKECRQFKIYIFIAILKEVLSSYLILILLNFFLFLNFFLGMISSVPYVPGGIHQSSGQSCLTRIIYHKVLTEMFSSIRRH